MKIFTDRELEFLIGLRTNWAKLYLSEVGRLLNEDASHFHDRLLNGRAFHSPIRLCQMSGAECT
jgi:hypothetical protein